VRLVQACLGAPSPLGFVVAYGTSANRHGWWDLGPARRLGYEPQDDAAAVAPELGEPPRDGRQGAEFAEPGYGGWMR
jgi:uronate dehydrogenase